ncbi:MAG: CDP-alcohol phosphatidyltransferase family protein [Candidatus Altiarchaeota archaeon]
MAKMGKVAKHIPNSMTLFNIIIGLSAIFFSMAHDYQKAGGLILISVIVDTFDGYVARMLKSTSKFGGYMDTVSDFLAFAMAASILMVNEFGAYPGVAVLFVVASVARLIYFLRTKNSTHFYGVPTTIAGGLLATIAILRPQVLPEWEMSVAMSLMMFVLSMLMLTRQRYYRIEIRKRKTLTMVLAVYASLFAISFNAFMISTMAMFIGYICLGWLPWLRKKEVDSLIPE